MELNLCVGRRGLWNAALVTFLGEDMLRLNIESDPRKLDFRNPAIFNGKCPREVFWDFDCILGESAGESRGV